MPPRFKKNENHNEHVKIFLQKQLPNIVFQRKNVLKNKELILDRIFQIKKLHTSPPN